MGTSHRRARAIHAAAPFAHVIILAERSRLAKLRHEMTLAPMIGPHWSLVAADDEALPKVVADAARAAIDSNDFRRLVLSDRFLVEVLTHTGDAIIYLDRTAVVRGWNRGAEILFGVAEEDALSRPWRAGGMVAGRRSVDRAQRPGRCMAEGFLPNQRRHAPLGIYAGAPGRRRRRGGGVGGDHPQHHRTGAGRAGITSSEERRRLALDSAELGAWHVNPATMELTTDARFRAIFGVLDEHLTYPQATALIHPDDRERVDDAVHAAMRLKDPAPYSIEYRVLHPDGTPRWVFAKGRANYVDEGGGRRLVSFDGTLADITDRKAAEDHAGASSGKHIRRVFLAGSAVALHLREPPGRADLHRPPPDLIGKNIWEEYPGLYGSPFEPLYRNAAGPAGVSGAITEFYPDHNCWYEIHIYPGPRGISVYFRDVSDRKQSEAKGARRVPMPSPPRKPTPSSALSSSREPISPAS